MKIKNNNPTKTATPYFGMKMVKSIDYKIAEDAGWISDAVREQVNSLAKRMDEIAPFDREIVFGYEKSSEVKVFNAVMEAYFQYFIKPFEKDPATGEYTEKFARYITGSTCKNAKEFFKKMLTIPEKSYLLEKAEEIAMAHEDGEITLNLVT